MNPNFAVKEEVELNDLPREAVLVLQMLDQIENHTAELRKKLMLELKPNGNTIKLNLDKVE